MKSKVVAGILGILLGGWGIHKFYLGKVGAGILHILFWWTGIPTIIGVIEGIIYLVSDEKTFQQKYCKVTVDDIVDDERKEPSEDGQEKTE